jgi:hypothetical protein
MKVLGIIFGGFVAAIFAALIVYGAASELGYLPSPDTLAENEVPDRYLTELRESGVIDEDERIYFFYSAGIFSILEDGNLFTNKRVISYEIYEEEFDIYTAYYNEIEKIEMNKSNELWGESEIRVTKKDGSWFVLFVDNENDKDTRFLEKLNKVWSKEKS